LGEKGENNKVGGKSQEISSFKIPQVNPCLQEESK